MLTKCLLAALALSAGPACLGQTQPIDAISPDYLPAPGILGQGRCVTPPPMPPITCFAEGTDPAIVASVNHALSTYLEQNFYTSQVQWGVQGQPVIVTWSLVADGTIIPGDAQVGDATSPSTLFSTMDSKFGGIANRGVWISQIQACFDRWALLTGLTFTRVSVAGQPWDDGGQWGSVSGATRGTIRIAMHNIDGPNGVLGFCYFPSNATGWGGDMVLDSSENWGDTTSSYRMLRNTVGHELGHGLGLMHVCPNTQTKLMEPFLSMNYDGPQHDDVRGVQYLYGDAYEPNNNAAGATPLPNTVVNNSQYPSELPTGFVPGVYMTSLFNGDEDWFRSTVITPIVVDFRLNPAGLSYDSSTQNQDGTCNSGSTINSGTLADLAFEIRASDGTTVLASQNANGPGQGEYNPSTLLSPGTYYIRVFETNSFPGTQEYTLSIYDGYTPTLNASDGDFNSKVRVSWNSLPWATEYAVYRATSNNRPQATLLGLLGQGAGVQWDDTTVTQGVTYYYWVEAEQGGGGLRPMAGPTTGYAGATPANNNCASAYEVGEGTFHGSTSFATNDGSALCGNSNSNKDVWYHFTANSDGVVKISTCGTNDAGGVDTGMDTVLSVHAGCPGTSANTLVCNDDAAVGLSCSGADSGLLRDSAVSVNAVAGQQFLVRVSGYGSSAGEFVLNVHYLPPVNDLCAAALPVSNGTTHYSTAGAGTDGPSETLCNLYSYPQVSQDIWFRYTAPCSGTASVDTCGSTYDTKLAVYHGVCPSFPGSVIACDDDAADPLCFFGSRVTFPVAAGQDYLLRVGGYGAAYGNGTLNIYCASACGSPDFNCDGDVGTDADIEAFFACLAGTCPGAPCPSNADFNADGDVGTDADIESFFRVLAGGNC